MHFLSLSFALHTCYFIQFSQQFKKIDFYSRFLVEDSVSNSSQTTEVVNGE